MNKQEKTALTAVGIIGGVALLYVLYKRTEAAPPNGNGNGQLPPGTSGMHGFIWHTVGTDTTPLAGATITVAGQWSTVSEADGSFQITGIAPGDHIIVAECPGYLTREYGPWTFYADDTLFLNVHIFEV